MNFELRSSSLKFGNVNKLTFLSLKRDLFPIHNIDSLLNRIATSAFEGVDGIGLLCVGLCRADRC